MQRAAGRSLPMDTEAHDSAHVPVTMFPWQPQPAASPQTPGPGVCCVAAVTANCSVAVGVWARAPGTVVPTLTVLPDLVPFLSQPFSNPVSQPSSEPMATLVTACHSPCHSLYHSPIALVVTAFLTALSQALSVTVSVTHYYSLYHSLCHSLCQRTTEQPNTAQYSSSHDLGHCL